MFVDMSEAPNPLPFDPPLGLEAIRTLVRLAAGDPINFREIPSEAGSTFIARYLKARVVVTPADQDAFREGATYDRVLCVDSSEQASPRDDSLKRFVAELRGAYSFCRGYKRFDYDWFIELIRIE